MRTYSYFLIFFCFALIAEPRRSPDARTDALAMCYRKAESTGKCTGSAYCTACKTCEYCAYCNSGGSCGVCRPDKSRRQTTAVPQRSAGPTRRAQASFQLPEALTYLPATVVAERLNVRQGPGAHFEKLGEFAKGDVLLVANIGSPDWLLAVYPIDDDHVVAIGFVARNYLRF